MRPYQKLFSVPRLIGREFSAQIVVYMVHSLSKITPLAMRQMDLSRTVTILRSMFILGFSDFNERHLERLAWAVLLQAI
ncbi:MAG TPA: hypothetical protein P5244_15100, partial [Syntrophales bacterium]|nr:hypothetical protein [Syntrophales bacterium]